MAGAAKDKGEEKQGSAPENATPVQKRLAELHEAELSSDSSK